MSSERSPLLRTTTQGSPNNGNRNNAGSVEVRTDVPLQEINADTNINTIKDNESNPAAQYYLRSKWRKSALFVVLLLVNVLGPLSTETQVPALQQIADDLNTSSTWVQMSITIYMLCFGAFQLVFGTLSDIYGRRNVLLVGLVIYCGTNIGCAFAPNIIALNVFRAIQAMGSGAGMVIVIAIARDVYDDPIERTQILNILTAIRPVVIASSPIFGGAVAAYLGWRYIFAIIGAFSFVILIAVFFLFNKDTRHANTMKFGTFSQYVEAVKILISNRVFTGLVLISGAVYAGVFIMFNELSFVFENEYGFTEFYVGLICGLIVFGLLAGAGVSWCINKYQPQTPPFTIILMGCVQLVICSVFLVIPIIFFDDFSYQWSVIPLFAYVMCDGLMMGPLLSSALEPFKRQVGTASSVAQSYRFFSAAVIALIASSVSNAHRNVLHVGTAAMAVLCVVIFFVFVYGADYTQFAKSGEIVVLNDKASAEATATGEGMHQESVAMATIKIPGFNQQNGSDDENQDETQINETTRLITA